MTREIAVTAITGRTTSQVETGMSRRAFHAVSARPWFPATIRAVCNVHNEEYGCGAHDANETDLIAPAVRNRDGVRSHADAAHNANAPHMVIE